MRLAKSLFTFLLMAAALSFFGAWPTPAEAAKSNGSVNTGSSQANPRVDTASVHRLYLEGEFDAAIAILEGNLKETRQYARGDSAFIFKHLGVMYAANIDTREKGKYYMHRLLSVEPTAKIMDMYASDMIYMIFKNIQQEYAHSQSVRAGQRQNVAHDESISERNARGDRPDADRRQAGVSNASGSGKRWLWAGVAAATVAAGVGAYVLMNDEPSKPTETEARF